MAGSQDQGFVDKRPFDRAGAIRPFRDHYAAPFVGVSYDLAPRAVGIHPGQLAHLPDLVGRRVLVTRDRGPRTPLHRRPAFDVVQITRLMRNAADVGGEGGIVFSSFDLEDPDAAPVLRDLDVGEVVYLNAAIERLPEYAIRRPFQDDGDASAS